MQNKKSIWSTIILIVAILTIITTTIEFVSVVTSVERVKEIALEEANGDDFTSLLVNVAASSFVTGAVIGVILAAFQIIGGFLFSLKGKWGTFCIVISILGIFAQGINLSNNLTTNGVLPLTIVMNFVMLAIYIVYCIACFKHRSENLELDPAQ